MKLERGELLSGVFRQRGREPLGIDASDDVSSAPSPPSAGPTSSGCATVRGGDGPRFWFVLGGVGGLGLWWRRRRRGLSRGGMLSVATGVFAASACGLGCSSSSSEAKPIFDASPSTLDAAVVDEVILEANAPDTAADLGFSIVQSCDPSAPFRPIPWAPPLPFRDACSSAQITAYWACLGTYDCASFRSVAANAACITCLETDLAASQHGPVITQGVGAARLPIELNSGGCIALYDGDTSGTGCGATYNKHADCYTSDCGNCSDSTDSNPLPTGPTATCQHSSAGDGGSCAPYVISRGCSDEGVSGPAAPCFMDILTVWCGGGANTADAGDGGNAEGG